MYQFFRPYRSTDVTGHVRIRGVWMRAVDSPAGTIVTRLGWGDTFAGFLADYPEDEQHRLRTTLHAQAGRDDTATRDPEASH
jgi:hypothetical protein